MPLKTLHLTNSWHETSGGIATFYRALIAAANRRGRNIRLVVPGETGRVEDVGEFAKVYYVKAPRARFNGEYRTLYPSQYVASGSRVQQILVAERPNVVEICDKYTLNYLGALLRRRLLPALDFRPVVVGLSCERMDDNFRAYVGRVPLSRTFCAAYMKWIYFPFFDHHIANSEYTAEELRAASEGQMVDRNIWIEPMGVDLEHFSPQRRSNDVRHHLLRHVGGNHDSVLLFYAGRLAPEKNLSLLFELVVCLGAYLKRDYRLLVAGDGIERARWEAFCDKHAPKQVAFLGHIKGPDELADLFANVDLFVHPNPREPFGIAPLEAMASGLPLVAPDRGGVTSYANAENAWVAPANVESFAAAIDGLLANESERNRRAQNALRTAAEYRWDRVASSFLDLYAELARASLDRGASCALPPPAFSSTPPRGFQLALSRGVSRSAERAFRIASALFSR
jgi:glycosyltransferase involved in cell wall biosynthesis